MSKINESSFLNKFRDILNLIYSNWWAERNGGNLSVILDDDFIEKYKSEFQPSRKTEMNFECKNLMNKYILLTGSGKFFRNISDKSLTEANAGIIKISPDGKFYEIVWGFNENSIPTSELPTHLMTHSQRLEVDSNHRVVIHSHPTNVVALTFVENLDEKEFNLKMWRMISEASVVFPEGVGILKWMVPGSNEIGIETAKKMKTFKSVIWAHHGIFCTGNTLDETLGLLECIEKSAKIYLKIIQTNKNIIQQITDEELFLMEKKFGTKLNEKIITKRNEE